MRERAFYVQVQVSTTGSLLLSPLHHDVCDAVPSGETTGCPGIRTGKS